MVTIAAVLIGVVLGTILGWLLGARAQVPPPVVRLPFPHVAIPTGHPQMPDTMTLQLFDTLHDTQPRYEIALHTDLLPQTYTYAGGTYRRWRRLRDRMYAFVLVDR